MLAQATTQRDGTVRLRFPFNRDLVTEIKATLMSHQRTYDPATKEWTVSPGGADVAIGILRRYYGADLVVEHAVPSPPITRDSDWSYASLHLLPSAPPQLVRAAYKTLATLVHPDKTGDGGERMRALNATYDSLRQAGAA